MFFQHLDGKVQFPIRTKVPSAIGAGPGNLLQKHVFLGFVPLKWLPRIYPSFLGCRWNGNP